MAIKLSQFTVIQDKWDAATDEEKIDIIEGGQFSIAMLQDGEKSNHPKLAQICRERLKDDRLIFGMRHKREVYQLFQNQGINLSETIRLVAEMPEMKHLQNQVSKMALSMAKMLEGYRRALLLSAQMVFPDEALADDIKSPDLFDFLAHHRPGWASILESNENDLIYLDADFDIDAIGAQYRTDPEWATRKPAWLTDVNGTGWIDRLGFVTVIGLLKIEAYLRKADIEKREADVEKREKALKRRRMGPIAPDGFLRGSSDRISKAMIESLTPGAMRQRDEIEPALAALEGRGAVSTSTFWAAYPFENPNNGKGDVYGAIGYKTNPGEAIWAMLQKNGAIAIKMQFVLWARAYTETNAEPGQVIRLSVNQLCDDLGYKRKKGAHKKENKQTAAKVFEMLTGQEIAGIFTHQGRSIRLRGPIWNRGLAADESEDLFGWVPAMVSYAPGDWFSVPEWRAYNRNVAMTGEGILKLTGENKDKHAVFIAGYMATLARMNNYRAKYLKVKTLLEKSGLWAADSNHNPGRMIDKLERALDRLIEVDVIKGWRYRTAGDAAIDPDNLDDPDTLAALADDGADPNERNRTIIIEWPDKLTRMGEVNAEKKQKHIKEAKTKKSRSKRGAKYPPPSAE